MQILFSSISFFFSVFRAELAGRYADNGFESLGKILSVNHAAMQGDRLYLQVGHLQQMLSVRDALIQNIGRQRLSCFGFEAGREIDVADMQASGKSV